MQKRFTKGSKAAKDFMAKLRSKRKNVGAIKIVEKGESATSRPTATYQYKRTARGTFKGLKRISGSHKDSKSHNVNVRVVSGIDVVNLPYGEIFGTSLQLYLVKFQSLSFQLLAVAGDGLKKALRHPEGKNQKAIVYKITTYGIPKFEKMNQSEIKKFS